MAYQHGERRPSRMIARGDDPWVSVSLLSEHVYCPRAGVLLFEKNQEDSGEEEVQIAGKRQVTIFYTIGQIQRELQRLQSILKTLAMTTGIMAIVFIISFIVATWLPFLTMVTFLAAIGGISCIVGLAIVGAQWLSVYYDHYLPAKNARPYEPPISHTEPHPVEWWSLINAGFQVVRPSDQYRYPEWHLAGCPWRLLVRGTLRIPVFRARLRREGENRLFRKHFARMAAYCHLVEKSEHAQSPYGVVLFGNTLKGLTVPITPSSNKAFHDGLVGARSALIALRAGHAPSRAHSSKVCLNCPHSRQDRMTGASECGTRFHWTPPNAWARRRNERYGYDDDDDEDW